MKKYLLIINLCIGIIVSAQVGIGTITPTEKLEIAGNAAIGTSVYIDSVNYVNNPSGFTVVATDPQSSIVNGKLLAVENLYTPLTIQPYSVTNIYRDDLNDLNLNISADKFFITLTNFEAVPNAGNNGIYTDPNAVPVNKGNLIMETFVSNGIWHVKIGYPTLNTENITDRYTYNFDIILYSKRFFKDLGTITYDLGGNNTGIAPSAPPGI